MEIIGNGNSSSGWDKVEDEIIREEVFKEACAVCMKIPMTWEIGMIMAEDDSVLGAMVREKWQNMNQSARQVLVHVPGTIFSFLNSDFKTDC